MSYDPLYDPPEDIDGEAFEEWSEKQESFIEMCGGPDEVEDLLLELYEKNDPVFYKYVDKNYEQYKRDCEESRFDI